MANEMIKFLRGNVASLPATATAGAVYFTKDEGLYLGLEDGSYHRYGDFITVADVASLPETGAHETCMYYCLSENILAKWSEAEGKWIQINKQKTLAELGGVAKSVYDAKMAALEKADSDNATAISGVDTRLQAAEEKLKSVATTEGLGELTDRVGAAETDINNLQAAIAEGGSVTLAIADAKQAGLDAKALAETKTTMADVEAKDYATKAEAQGYANAKDEAIGNAQSKADEAYNLANGKATMEQVNAAIAGAGHAVKADVDTALENLGKAYVAADTALETKLQGNIDKKVDKTAYDAKVAELAGADTTLQGNIDALAGKVGTPTEGKTIVDMIADAQTAATYDDTKIKEDIKANADAIDAIEADYLKKADKDELQGNINTLTGVVETLRDGIDADKVDGIKDLIKYVEDHGPEVTGMKEDIAENAKAISDHETLAAQTYETKTDAGNKLVEAKGYTDTEVAKDRERLVALEGKVDVEKVSTAIAAEKTRAEAKEAELAGSIATNLQTAKDYADDAVEALGIGDYIKKADADVAYATAGHNHDDKYDAKGDAAQALVDAKAHTDNLANGQVKTNKEAIEAINNEATGLLKQAKDYADGKASTAQANAEATAAGALASAKTELEGKITSGDSATLASAQAYADQAELDAISAAKTETEKQVKALADGQVDTNKNDIATIIGMLTWGSFGN